MNFEKTAMVIQTSRQYKLFLCIVIREYVWHLIGSAPQNFETKNANYIQIKNKSNNLL
jgi:hypothetical protein